MLRVIFLLVFLVPSIGFAMPKECRRLVNPYDGAKRDFLWKQSDDYPGAVVLLPEKYKMFTAVTIINSRSKTLDTLRYFYPYSEDGSNRPVWRANKRADAFPKNIYVRGVKGKVCWRLREPSRRID